MHVYVDAGAFGVELGGFEEEFGDSFLELRAAGERYVVFFIVEAAGLDAELRVADTNPAF